MRFIEILYSPKFFDRFDTIKRWSNWHTIKQESLPHHSWWVTMITRMLCVELELPDHFRLEAMDYSLTHELDEAFSGDLDHTLKYNKHSGDDMRDSLGQFIRESFYDFFCEDSPLDEYFLSVLALPSDTKVKWLVKLADIIAFQQYLRLEMRMGNRVVEKAYNNSKRLLVQHQKKDNHTWDEGQIEFLDELFTKLRIYSVL